VCSQMSWSALVQELDAWKRVGRQPSMWLRDDDVQTPTAALDRLFDLVTRHNIAPCLAAIPKLADPRLTEYLSIYPETRVATHGFLHRNYAPVGERKIEWGSHRPSFEVLAEIERSSETMDTLFGNIALPVLVPPWNRMNPDLYPHLYSLGVRGLSTLGAREINEVSTGVQQTNVHVDILNWQPEPHFRGIDSCVHILVQHLSNRRMGIVDQNEPTGLLTHHLVMDEPSWKFLDSLLTVLTVEQSTIWPHPDKIFSVET